MKVYLLSYIETGELEEIPVAVFSTPKKARKFRDDQDGVNSRGKWYKHEDGYRWYNTADCLWFVTEYVVDNPV